MEHKSKYPTLLILIMSLEICALPNCTHGWNDYLFQKHYKKANQFYDQKKYKPAIHEYGQALKYGDGEEPEKIIDIYYQKARSNNLIGDEKGIIAGCSNALSLIDGLSEERKTKDIIYKEFDCYFLRGVANLTLEKNRPAISDLDKAISLFPVADSPMKLGRLYLFEAKAYLNINDKVNADDKFRKACILKDPDACLVLKRK